MNNEPNYKWMLDVMFTAYPNERYGFEYLAHVKDNAVYIRECYSLYTLEKLIKAFRSHEWKGSTDRYAHDGLSVGAYCKKCKRRANLPHRRLTEYTDNEILSYHFVYGRQKQFGGRITKCTGQKRRARQEGQTSNARLNLKRR